MCVYVSVSFSFFFLCVLSLVFNVVSSLKICQREGFLSPCKRGDDHSPSPAIRSSRIERGWRTTPSHHGSVNYDCRRCFFFLFVLAYA